MFGAVWNVRHTAGVLVGLWVLGLLVGSLHPLGVLAALAELATFTAFTAALGTWISLRARHTMQALARVMASLLLLNAGSLLLTLPVLGRRPLALAACGPLLLAASSFGLAPNPALDGFGAGQGQGQGPEMVLTCLVSVLGATAAAWVLTRSACRGFDAYLDRPAITGAAVSASAPGPWRGRRAARGAPPHGARERDYDVITTAAKRY
jgi:hypothetical protein